MVNVCKMEDVCAEYGEGCCIARYGDSAGPEGGHKYRPVTCDSWRGA